MQKCWFTGQNDCFIQRYLRVYFSRLRQVEVQKKVHREGADVLRKVVGVYWMGLESCEIGVFY